MLAVSLETRGALQGYGPSSVMQRRDEDEYVDTVNPNKRKNDDDYVDIINPNKRNDDIYVDLVD